jgi:mevalonate kinase
MKVTIQQISDKIKSESYLVLQDGRTTLCTLTLENGYTVHGTSSCVDPAEFDLNQGRFHAFNNAMDQIWPLEGYLLAQFIYETTTKTQEPTKEVVAKKKTTDHVKKVLDDTLKSVAPFGYKKDGTPKKAPGRPAKASE